MSERIVGIDFGTSTSVIRVKRYNDNGIPIGDISHVIPVTFNMGSTVVPTLIRKTDSDTVYGYDAQVFQKKSTVYQNFKVDLESEDEEKKQQARQLTGDFFKYLAETYNEQSAGGHLGDSTDEVRTLISYPVKWSDETKKFMIETAKNAGFANVEGMDEAQAAISAVLVQNADHLHKHGYISGADSVNILLIDMGAGTTDLVLCKYYIEQKKTEIICTWPKAGDILFGGKEVDELLRNHVKGKLPEDECESVIKRCGLDKFKAWKENMVSPALKKNDRIEEFSELDMIIDLLEIDAEDYSIDRSVFESFSKDYLQKFSELVNGCIEESKMNSADVDIVILTGGHSQWYFVNEILSGQKKDFGEIYLKKIVEDNNRILPITLPQETVALGLVYSSLKQEIEVAPPPPVLNDFVATDCFFGMEGENSVWVEGTVPKGERICIYDVMGVYRNGIQTGKGTVKIIQIMCNFVGSAKENERASVCLTNLNTQINKGDVLKKIGREQPPVVGDNTKMTIKDVFMLGNKRIAVLTVVPDKTVISVGDNVEIIRDKRNVGTGIIKGIARGKIQIQSAVAGDEVGLLFEGGEGIRKNDVLRVKKTTAVSKVTVSAKAVPSEGGRVSGAGSYNRGDTVVLTAVPSEDYEFIRWSNGDTYPSVTFKAADNVTYMAEFGPKEPEVTPAEEFELDSINGCYSIRKYIGNRSHVVIPEEIKGRKVVAIGANAFCSNISSLAVEVNSSIVGLVANRTIISVVIPDTVTTIKSNAFSNCRALETVTMSRNIEVIESNVFSDCINLRNIDLGNKLKEIPNNAFFNCRNLESVKLPASIEKIGAGAFFGCNNLLYLDFGSDKNEPGVVHLPRNLKEIGDEAFLKSGITGGCIFKEVMLSKKTRIKKDLLRNNWFSEMFKNCAVFYYED